MNIFCGIIHTSGSSFWDSGLDNKMSDSLTIHGSSYLEAVFPGIIKTFNDILNSLKQQRLKYPKSLNNRSPEYKFLEK